nr:unnamed protein product [Callosobruchus analis]
MNFQIEDTGTLAYMWVSLIVNGTRYFVCVIYRPPRSRLDVCANFFDNALPQCLTEFDNIVVLVIEEPQNCKELILFVEPNFCLGHEGSNQCGYC